jgi:hypothetical protein
MRVALRYFTGIGLGVKYYFNRLQRKNILRIKSWCFKLNEPELRKCTVVRSVKSRAVESYFFTLREKNTGFRKNNYPFIRGFAFSCLKKPKQAVGVPEKEWKEKIDKNELWFLPAK